MDVFSLVENMKKKHEQGIVTLGGELPVIEDDLLSTGIFPFDLSIGGGFQRGKIHVIYGPQSSGKSNIALKLIAEEQRKHPNRKCVLLDTENSFDRVWAQRLGVQVEELVIIRPNYAEQAVDMVEAFMRAEDLSVLVLDSIADLIPVNEAISTAEKSQVGGNSAIVSKMMKKLVALQCTQAAKGLYPTFIGINQVRHKIGQLFGNPEYMPGGNLMHFATNMIVRVSGKDKMEKSANQVVPVLKEMKVTVKRWKRPIVAQNCEFDFVTIAHNGRSVGEVADWPTLSTYLRDFGWLEKKANNKWSLFGEEFPTLKACREFIYSDPAYEDQVKKRVIRRAIVEVNNLEETVEEEGDSQEESVLE